MLKADPTAGNERLTLRLPDNRRINPPTKDKMGISQHRLHRIAASPENESFDLIFSQPGGDVLRGALIHMSGRALKASRLQLVSQLLSGETEFSLRTAWLPKRFRDRVDYLTVEYAASAPSSADSHKRPERLTSLADGYWIELPENVSHSIGDGRLDRYTIDDMIRNPGKDTFDHYFSQSNGIQLRQYLVAGAQLMPAAGNKIQKVRKQLRSVVTALVKGETRILLQNWSQFSTATRVVMPDTESSLHTIAPETEAGHLTAVALQEINSAEGQQLWRAVIANSAALTERSASHTDFTASHEAEQRHSRIMAICQLHEVRKAIPAEKMDDFCHFLDGRLKKNPHLGTPPVAEYLGRNIQRQPDTPTQNISKPVVNQLIPDTRLGIAETFISRERRQVTSLQRDMRAHNQFKALVWENFDRRCAVTRKHWLGELDAAHIEDAIYGCFSVSNGLLLSPTLHRLFGRFKMSINPDSMTAHFLPDSGFEDYEGALITPVKWSIDKEKLAAHWQVFHQRRRKLALSD